jgi:hypothetical protein
MGDKYAKQQALQSPETLSTVIHAIMRQQFGDEAYNWDPLTSALEARDEFGAEMDTASLDRWSALQIVMTSDAFFKRLDAFLGICNTMNEGVPFFQIFDPVTTEEAAWAITEVSLNRELLPFSYPIRKYLKLILAKDGFAPGSYPTVFKEVFEKTPDAEDIREDLASTHNRNNIEVYIDEQLQDMVYQFNKIPTLKQLDDMILQRSMDEYVHTLVKKEG